MPKLTALIPVYNDDYALGFCLASIVDHFDEIIVLDTVISCMDSENLMESGQMRTAVRNRSDWEFDFARYIDTRVVSTNKIMPFAPHYGDS